MIYFIALIPATGLTIAGYFVLYLSNRSDGTFQKFGRYLGFWAFTLAGLVVLAAISLQLTVAAMAPCAGCTAGCTAPDRVIHGSLDLAKMMPRPLHSPGECSECHSSAGPRIAFAALAEVRRRADHGFSGCQKPQPGRPHGVRVGLRGADVRGTNRRRYHS